MEEAKIEDITKQLVETNNEMRMVEAKISQSIAQFKKQLVSLKEKDEALRESIRKAMADTGMKKFENDFIAMTYIAPTTRTTLDTARIKEEAPEVYEQFSKVSEVKDSVRITIKEGEK